MASDVDIRILKSTIDTTKLATETQDFTIAGWGKTPVLARFFITHGGSDSFGSDPATRFSFGAATSATNSWATGWWWTDGEASVGVRRWAENGYIGKLFGNSLSGNEQLELQFDSFISNGVRVKFFDDVNADGTVDILIVMYAGADVDAAALYESLGDSTQTIDVTAPAFEPTLLGTMAHGDDLNDSWGSFFTQSIGFAQNQTTDRQVGYIMEKNAGTGSGAPEARLDTSYISMQGVTGVGHRESVGSYDANGFSLTVSDGANNDDWPYWAIGTGDRETYVNTLNSPTSNASDWDVTGIGFKPQYVEMISTMLTATDSSSTDATAGAFGFHFFDSYGEEHSLIFWDEKNADPINTGFSWHTKALHLLEDDGATVAFDASGPTFETNGFKFAAADITTANATGRKFICVAVEEVAATEVTVTRDAKFPIGNRARYTKNTPLPTGFTSRHLLDSTVPTSHTARVERDEELPTGWSGRSVSNSLSPAEWRRVLSTDVVLPSEWGRILSTSESLPLDWIVRSARNSPLPLGWELRTTGNFTLPLEWKREVTQISPLPSSWVRRNVGDASLPAGWGVRAVRDHRLPVEWRGTTVVAAVRDALHPVGWRTRRTLDTEEPLSWISRRFLDSKAPYSHRARVSLDSSGPVEWSLGVVSDLQLPLGNTRRALSDSSLPLEWRGSVLIRRDAQFPLSWLRRSTRDSINLVEFRARFSRDSAESVEWALRATRDFGLVAEGLKGTITDGDLAAEWRSSLLRDAEGLVDWRTGNLRRDAVLHVENLRRALRNANLPHGWTGRVLRDGTIRLEWTSVGGSIILDVVALRGQRQLISSGEANRQLEVALDAARQLTKALRGQV